VVYLHDEYAERREKYSILFIFSQFCEYDCLFTDNNDADADADTYDDSDADAAAYGGDEL